RGLPLAGRRGPQRTALRRPRVRPLLGDRAGPRHADRVPRGGARPPVVPPVAALRPLRWAVRLRVPRHRRHGGLHPDAELGHVRALPAAAVRGPGGGLELDRVLARPARPQAPRDGAPDADPHGAQRILLPSVSDLGRSGRVLDRPDGGAPRGRLLHLGLGLSAYRRVDGCGPGAAGAPRASARRIAPEDPRRQRAALLQPGLVKGAGVYTTLTGWSRRR